jgi:hypothetical protein
MGKPVDRSSYPRINCLATGGAKYALTVLLLRINCLAESTQDIDLPIFFWPLLYVPLVKTCSYQPLSVDNSPNAKPQGTAS